MKKLIGPIVVVVLVGAGAFYLLRPQKETLGTPPPGSTSVSDIGTLSAEQEGQMVRISGTIIKECPSAGCWAYIKDDTGEIRIETTAGGFALPLRREGSKIEVTGTVKVKDSGDLEIDAMSAEL